MQTTIICVLSVTVLILLVLFLTVSFMLSKYNEVIAVKTDLISRQNALIDKTQKKVEALLFTKSVSSKMIGDKDKEIKLLRETLKRQDFELDNVHGKTKH